MVPAWIVNTLIIILGCVFAIYFGSSLPEYDMLGAYMLGFLIVCTICLVTNNFPLLLALAFWYPFPPPVPMFRSFPAVALVLAWFTGVLFFKWCITKSLPYVKSYNLLIVLCFAWVPIRFLMNPVKKLGNQVLGGSGISGANSYFLYALAGVVVVYLGFILTDRKKLTAFMRWSFLFVYLDGLLFLTCSFIPSSAQFLMRLGAVASGFMGDGILRFLALPGYGLFLVEAAFCPALFRLNRGMSIITFLLGMAMMVVGGNRSAMAAAIIAVPVILFLRRKTHALIMSIAVFVFGVAMLSFMTQHMDANRVPSLLRSFGMLNNKIAESTGGNASAKWRYLVWQSGLEKIKQAPLVGNGFGNLDKRRDIEDGQGMSTDFEVVVASGEAHNGFVSAAYAFGVPFMVALTIALILRMFSHMRSALISDKHDPELRDFHAYLGGAFATFGILIYTAFDMCTVVFWLYAGIGIILDHVTRKSIRLGQGNILPPKGDAHPVHAGITGH